MPERSAFHDLKPDEFPFTIEFRSTATGDLLWSQTVDAPGAVQIPGRGELKEAVDVRMVFATGDWVEITYDGQERHGTA